MPAIHVFNRGVEGRNIFADKEDSDIFITYLKEYLNPPVDPKALKKTFEVNGKTFSGVPHLPKNFHKKIELITYSLLPDHFHIILRENEKGTLQNFIRSLCTRYSIYYNKKYVRNGSLFIGPYKSAVVESDSELEALSKYIQHDQNVVPSSLPNTITLEKETSPLVRRDLNKQPEKVEVAEEQIPQIKKHHHNRFDKTSVAALTAFFFILTGLGLGNIEKEKVNASSGIAKVETSSSVLSATDTNNSDSTNSEIVNNDEKSLESPKPIDKKMVIVETPDSQKVNIYSDKSIDSEVITTAGSGDVFELINVDGAWSQVKVEGSSIGYVPTKYLIVNQNILQ